MVGTSALTGMLTALVTPLRDNAVDDAAFRTLCESQVAAGCGLVIGSDAGEGLMLEAAELLHLVTLAAPVATGRVPVLGYLDFAASRDAADFGRAILRAGADSLICRLPPASVFTAEDAYGYIRQISHRIDRPVLVDLGQSHDHPDGLEAMLGGLFNTELIEGVVMHELDPARLAARRAQHGDRFLQLIAGDKLAACHLAAGGTGWISTLGNVAPQACAALAHAWAEGDRPQFAAIRDALYAAEEGMRRVPAAAGLKAVLDSLGLADGAVRGPMRRVTAAAESSLLTAIEPLLRLERAGALPLLATASLGRPATFQDLAHPR